MSLVGTCRGGSDDEYRVGVSTTTSAPLPIRMLHDRVLVRPEKDGAESRTAAGLVIPVTAVGPRRLSWGNVVAAGEHVRQVSVDDRVLYDPEDKPEVELGGEFFVLLRERDVHAVSQSVEDSGPTGMYL